MDGNVNPALLDHLVGTIRRFAGNGVEDNVHIMDYVLKFRGVVVDYFIGSERAQKIVVSLRGGANHPCAFQLCELHGEAPNAASRAMNEDRLAGSKFPCVEQRLPGRQRGERNRAAVTWSIDFAFSATSDSRTTIYSA